MYSKIAWAEYYVKITGTPLRPGNYAPAKEQEEWKQPKREPSRVRPSGVPPWKALESHYKKIRKLHLRKLFADDPTRGERLTASAAGIELDYSKNRITDETLRASVPARQRRGPAGADRGHVFGSKINITENRAVLHTALRAPAGASIVVDGQNVVPRSPRRSRPHGRILRTGAERRMEGPYRQAHPQCRQYRDRRFRSRPRHGLRSAAALQPARHDLPLRLQRRWHRPRRGHSRSGPRGDTVHRLLQDFHHAGNHDQRAIRPRLVAGRIGGR